MSMKSINFNTGVKKYALNGDENNCIEINVNDPNLPARLDKIEAQMAAELDKIGDFDSLSFAERAELDRRIKDLLDEAFNSKLSERVFGATSCLTPLASGELFVMAFFNAFVPVVLADAEKAMVSFAKNSAKKAEQYIKDTESVEPGEGDTK